MTTHAGIVSRKARSPSAASRRRRCSLAGASNCASRSALKRPTTSAASSIRRTSQPRRLTTAVRRRRSRICSVRSSNVVWSSSWSRRLSSSGCDPSRSSAARPTEANAKGVHADCAPLDGLPVRTAHAVAVGRQAGGVAFTLALAGCDQAQRRRPRRREHPVELGKRLPAQGLRTGDHNDPVDTRS